MNVNSKEILEVGIAAFIATFGLKIFVMLLGIGSIALAGINFFYKVVAGGCFILAIGMVIMTLLTIFKSEYRKDFNLTGVSNALTIAIICFIAALF